MGWLSGEKRLARSVRFLAILGCGVGLLGAALLSFVAPPWNAHCAFAYCGRALGVGLYQSPFPVGTPSCRDLHMCGNEYVLSKSQLHALVELMEDRGCEPL